jgi:predicted ATPase
VPELYILTGAPGTGKTAILAGLDGAVETVAEPAREVLAEQRAAGAPPPRSAEFVRRLLARSIEKHQRAQDASGVVVFDRGVPDCIAYASYFSSFANDPAADPAEAVAAAAEYRYRPEVLIAEPWEAIYTTDEERQMSFDLVERFHEHVVAAYEQAGYRLVTVPKVALEERREFVRTFVT